MAKQSDISETSDQAPEEAALDQALITQRLHSLSWPSPPPGLRQRAWESVTERLAALKKEDEQQRGP